MDVRLDLHAVLVQRVDLMRAVSEALQSARPRCNMMHRRGHGRSRSAHRDAGSTALLLCDQSFCDQSFCEHATSMVAAGAVMPNSARCARIVLPILVRCVINMALVLCSISTLCCSTVFTCVRRRHAADLVAQLLDRSSPVARGCAGFDTDQTRLKLCEEGLDVRTTKLAAEDHLAVGIDAVGVKNVLSDIEAQRNWLPESLTGLRAGGWMPSTASIADSDLQYARRSPHYSIRSAIE